MNSIISILLAWMLILLSCSLKGQPQNQITDCVADTTIRIHTKHYKGVVFMHSYSPCFHLGEERLANRFTPSFQEIAESESGLRRQLNEALGNDPRVKGFKGIKNVQKHLRGKRRQYLGYINNKGQRVVYIQLLNFKRSFFTPALFKEWQKVFLVGFGRFYERNVERYQYNLTTRQLSL